LVLLVSHTLSTLSACSLCSALGFSSMSLFRIASTFEMCVCVCIVSLCTRPPHLHCVWCVSVCMRARAWHTYASCYGTFTPTIEGVLDIWHTHLRLKEAAVLKFLTLTAELMAERREMSKCNGCRLQCVR
jgi:hypothetical protein